MSSPFKRLPNYIANIFCRIRWFSAVFRSYPISLRRVGFVFPNASRLTKPDIPGPV